MNTAMKAMQVFSYAVATTTHNVANSTDPSYSRQLADITASDPLSIIGGQIGTGSQLAGVERIRDTYLDTQIMEMENNVGDESILDRTYQNLAAIFPEIDGVTSGLQAQMDQFFTDWQSLATQAQSGSASGILSAQNTLYQDALSLTQSLNSKSNSLSNMRADLTTDLGNDIDKANSYINQIYTLNGEIKQVYALGQSPNDLLDKRTAAMTSLSELINFDTQTSTDGTVTLIINGTPMVSGASGYNLLKLVSPSTGSVPATTPPTLVLDIQDPSQPLVGIGDSDTPIPTTAITGGEIAGILNSRDTVVKYYQDKLDETANTLITMVNTIYSAANLNGSANNNFFTGHIAGNIGLDASLNNGSSIAYSSNFTGADKVSNDIATILGGLGNKLVTTYVSSTNIGMNSSSTLPYTGKLIFNGATEVDYNTGMTVAGLVDAINKAGNGMFSAVFNSSPTVQQITIISSQGLNIADSNNLLSLFNFTENQQSAGPINYAQSGTESNVDYTKSWNSNKYQLDVQPTNGGGEIAVTINGVEKLVTWPSPTDKIANTISALGLPNINTQSLPSQGYSVGTKTVANTLSAFQITDITGNFTQVMKMVGNVTFDGLYSSTMNKLSDDASTADSMLSQYQASLTQLQTMQTQVTQVNVDNEEAQAELYQRGYDASVRLENVIDQMLNTLINDTGTPSNSTTSSL